MLLVASNASPDLWEPESRPFNHRKSFAAGREEGLHNAGLCFLMVVVRPGNRILGRRWEQILGWMWVGLWSGLVGRRDTWRSPGHPWTLAATYSVPRHKATLSIHQLKPHLLDRFTHANIP